jgi:hypothetical protein
MSGRADSDRRGYTVSDLAGPPVVAMPKPCVVEALPTSRRISCVSDRWAALASKVFSGSECHPKDAVAARVEHMCHRSGRRRAERLTGDTQRDRYGSSQKDECFKLPAAVAPAFIENPGDRLKDYSAAQRVADQHDALIGPPLVQPQARQELRPGDPRAIHLCAIGRVRLF